MSAVTGDAADRMSPLTRFGYSDSEASFLALAALHGGYFQRRQVGQFLGRRDGGVVTQLVQRALDLRHIRSSTWRQGVLLYHLCSRPFYEALGEPGNRNRRPHELAQIKNRIMSLDFVLAHPGERYLATERERLEHFDALGIDREKLPQKVFRSRDDRHCATRYFIEKYPLFVAAANTAVGPPVLTFTFVDEGLVTLSRFERYLFEYGALFKALDRFSLVYVAEGDAHFAAARGLFERFAAKTTAANAPAERTPQPATPDLFRVAKALRGPRARVL